jgi:hypothetical protein
MTYQLLPDELRAVRRLEDGATIPFDPGNGDYQQFLAWQEAGGVPEPAPAPPVVAPLTPAEKLAAAGLSIEELKGLLGLPAG